MRSNKNIYSILIVILLLVVTIGYAAISSTLNINGRSNISKNTWDVHFDNVVVNSGSVEAIKIPTIENNTKVDFEVVLNLPGDFYEFTVDVVNDGTIDAMIDSIEKTPDLTQSQLKYLNYIIEYQNGEQIASKQLIKKEEFVRLKVRVEYKSDVIASDLPMVSETLNLGFIVNYVQSDSNGNVVNDNGIERFVPVANGSIDNIGTIVTIDTEKFYVIGTEGDNVKLLSMYNLYVGGVYNDGKWKDYENEASGMQNKKMRGYVDNEDTRNGTTAFSLDEQTGTNYSDYSGSIVETFVNNYKDILVNYYGIDILEARLLTYNELTNSSTFGCREYSVCTSVYDWIYSTSYWLGTSKNTEDVYAIYSNGNFDNFSHDSLMEFGVRPVIVISKSYFE